MSLTPLPADGWRFASWAPDSEQGFLRVGEMAWIVMDGDRAVTVTFVRAGGTQTASTGSGSGDAQSQQQQPAGEQGTEPATAPVPLFSWCGAVGSEMLALPVLMLWLMGYSGRWRSQ